MASPSVSEGFHGPDISSPCCTDLAPVVEHQVRRGSWALPYYIKNMHVKSRAMVLDPLNASSVLHCTGQPPMVSDSPAQTVSSAEAGKPHCGVTCGAARATRSRRGSLAWRRPEHRSLHPISVLPVWQVPEGCDRWHCSHAFNEHFFPFWPTVCC